MTAEANARNAWAMVDGHQAWLGYDALIVTASSADEAQEHTERLRDLFSRSTKPPIIVGVTELPDAALGNLLGTLEAWRKATTTAPSIGGVLESGGKVALIHDAGAATRSAPLSLSEGSRGALMLPGSWGRDYTDDQPLRLLDLVAVQTLPFAASNTGALDVFWGSQLLIPSAPMRSGDHMLTKFALPVADASPRPDQLADLGLLDVDAEGRVCEFLVAGTFPDVAAFSQWRSTAHAPAWDLGSFRMRPELLSALLTHYKELPAGSRRDLDPDLTAPLVRATSGSAGNSEVAALLMASPALLKTDRWVGLCETGADSVWQRYRRPSEFLEGAEKLTASTDEAQALRAAHRIEHPIVRSRLGDVFVRGPELSFEEVRKGVLISGVVVKRSLVRHSTLMPGSKVVDSVLEDATASFDVERSVIVASAAQSVGLTRSALYRVALDQPLEGVDDCIAGVSREGLGATVVRVDMDLNPKLNDSEPVGNNTHSFAELRAMEMAPHEALPAAESIPPHRLRALLHQSSLARQVDLSLLASADASKAATRAIFAPVIRAADGLTRDSRDVAAASMSALWQCTRTHAFGGEVDRVLKRFGLPDGQAVNERYERVRAADRFAAPAEVKRIAVLSRVTLGADIAVTSVLLQRLHTRYPQATITLVGDRRCAELLGDAPGVRPFVQAYPRHGGLAPRLASWMNISALMRELDPHMVVSPDSRLDQLGSLPICDEARYALVETTFAGGFSSMAERVNQRCDELFGRGDDASPRVWLAHPESLPRPAIAVKLQTGGQRNKSPGPDFEFSLLKGLLERYELLLVDVGVGSEVRSATAMLEALGTEVVLGSDNNPWSRVPDGAGVLAWSGSIGGWARWTAACNRAISFDSVHGHLSRALGLETTVVFGGHPHPGFVTAWTPPGARLVSFEPSDDWRDVLARVLS